MSNRNRNYIKILDKKKIDFAKVGGLSEHIRILRETIITPLVYSDLYTRFNIKAPKGVLFYGPPGTGKTLVAGALANELNKEGFGKVSFFERKGADILDKWVGESEKKLREIFEKAARSRPAVIFFDELDGLAPARSQRNDQVHISVVATLLALMDGLDNMPGVIVIGATNRIEAIDPALRRPGRFDRELYFPLPNTLSRKEILQVHTSSWTRKPSNEFLSHLADMTSGYNGSDIQALCSEALLSCLKRLFPSLLKNGANRKRRISIDSVQVEERDFLNAKINIIPSTERTSNIVRKLNFYVKPLLQRQVENIVKHINVLWPHFSLPHYKYLLNHDRYAGRILLMGSHYQGLNNHIVPALLQAFEHLPVQTADIASIAEKKIRIKQHIPSILLIPQINDWWYTIDESIRIGLLMLLEEITASTPLLLISTCDSNVPQRLNWYYHNNSSLVISIENPNVQERQEFFYPLFFGKKVLSVLQVLYNCLYKRRKRSSTTTKREMDSSETSCQRSNENCERETYNFRLRSKSDEEKRCQKKSLESGDQGPSKPKKRKVEEKCKASEYIKNIQEMLCGGGNDSINVAPKIEQTASNHYKLKKSFNVVGSNQLNSIRSKVNTSVNDRLNGIQSKSSISNNFNNTETINSLANVKSHRNQFTSPFNSRSQNSQGNGLTNGDGNNKVSDSLNFQIREKYPKFEVEDIYTASPDFLERNQSTTSSFTTFLTDICRESKAFEERKDNENVNKSLESCFSKIMIPKEADSENQRKQMMRANSTDADRAAIYNLWHRTVHITSQGLNVARLELLYDAILACNSIFKYDFASLLPCLERTLTNFENAAFYESLTCQSNDFEKF